MKFNFKFSNLCGTVYRQGNLLFTPDGNSILSPVGNRVTILDLVNHKSRTLPFENRRDISRLALSPNGASLISVDEKGGALLVNFRKRVVLCQFQFKNPVADIQFSPDGKLIAVTNNQHIDLWKAPAMVTQFRPFHLIRTYTGHYDDVTCIRFSPDSKFFLTGSKDMTVRLYSCNPIRGFLPVTITAHKDTIVNVFLNPRLKQGMDDGLYTISKDGALFVWKFEDIKKEAKGRRFGVDRSMKKRKDRVEVDESAHWMARSNILLTKKHYFVQDHAQVTTAQQMFNNNSNDSCVIVVGFSNGVFGLYEMPSFNRIHTLSVSQHRITSLAINPTGEWIAFGASKLGQLLVWEWQSETYILKQQGHTFDINDLAYSPDGQLIVTGGDDAKVKVWNASTGFCFVTFKEHSGPVKQVTFSPKGNVVVSSSLDGTCRAFDLVRYRNFRTFTSPTPVQFTCLAIDNSGEMVVAGSLDPFEVYVWSLRTARLLDILSGHQGPISGVQFNPAHPYLVTSSWDKTLKVWDIYNRKVAVETLSHTSDVVCVAVRPDGDQVCTGDLTGNLYFWDPQDGSLSFTIDGSKDIRGGRRQNDRRSAANSTHSLCFTSVCYSADGTTILAGGNSKYVCIYQVAQKVLLKRFEITNNLSLDGILTFLNSREMTDAGPMALIDDEPDDIDKEKEDYKDNSLPGAKRSDFSSRKASLAALTKCVSFSPDGRQWAAASVEGLLIYSLDENLTFDPTDLDMEVTPDNVKLLLDQKNWSKALVMALRLNDHEVLFDVLGLVPHDDVELIARSIPELYVERVLSLLAEKIENSPHIQFYLRWVVCMMQSHGSMLRHNGMRMLSTLRALHKKMTTSYSNISNVCQDNYYSLGFLTKNSVQPQVSLIDQLVKGDEEEEDEEETEDKMSSHEKAEKIKKNQDTGMMDVETKQTKKKKRKKL